MGALDDTRVNKKLNMMLKQKKIQLVDEKTGQPKYEKQINKAVESPGVGGEQEDDDDMYSPERKTKTLVKVAEADMAELEQEVKGAIERKKGSAVAQNEEEKDEFVGDDINDRVELPIDEEISKAEPSKVEESKSEEKKSGKKSGAKKQNGDILAQTDLSLNDRELTDEEKKTALKQAKKDFKEACKDAKQAAVEVKSLGSPPQAVMDTLGKVLVLLGHSDLSWKNCVNVANKEAYKFAVYDPKNITKEQRKAAGKTPLDPAAVATKSLAASKLANWVQLALRVHDLS